MNNASLGSSRNITIARITLLKILLVGMKIVFGAFNSLIVAPLYTPTLNEILLTYT